jgi:hypothetical protein
MMVEWMSKEERLLTPTAFADYLVGRVMRATGSDRVAALYVAACGPYPRMRHVDSWPVMAQHYNGPYPIVAHPPCGPWGKLRWNCKYQDESLGRIAINQVHLFGGIVEQPLGSILFRDYGRPGAVIEKVYQSRWGHRADKATLLYVVLP